jgi:ABC-type transport system substrate-binding protein
MNVNNEFKLFAPKVREALGMAIDINQAPKVGTTMGPRGT